MSIETILCCVAWGIVIILILIIACQSGFQKKPAEVKDFFDKTVDNSPDQAGQQNMVPFAADAYAKMQERKAKIAEYERSGSESAERRKELEEKLLAKMLYDLDNIKTMINTDTLTYTLRQNGAALTYKFLDLTIRINECEYKYTDMQKLAWTWISQSERECLQNENKEFCENALQYLLPWGAVLEDIYSGIHAEIEKQQEIQLAEAISAEAAEKEKERALLSSLGFDPDDPQAYDEAMKSIKM